MLQASKPPSLARFAGVLWAWLGLALTAYAQTTAPAAHAQLVAEARRIPAELTRRPDGLEEVEAITRGATVPAWPTAVAFHPDGTRVALIDDRGAVDLWHWEEDRHIRRETAPGFLHQLAFSNDGKTLIAAEGEALGYLYLLNAQNGTLQALFGHTYQYWLDAPPRFWQPSGLLIAFLPHALAEYRGRVRGQGAAATAALPLPPIVSVIQDRQVKRTWTPPTKVHAIHMNASGRWLALVPAPNATEWPPDRLRWDPMTGSKYGLVEIYELETAQKQAVLRPQKATAFSLASSSDGSLLMTLSQASAGAWQTEIWDSKSGQRLGRVAGTPANHLWSLMLPPESPFSSGDGRWLVFAQGARHVLWDAQSRKTRRLATVWGSAAFAAGTSLLIDAPASCVRAPIVVWDLAKDRQITLQNPTSTPYPAPVEYLDCRKWRPQLDPFLADRSRLPPRSAAHVGVGLLAVWQFSYSTSGTDGYHVYGPEGDRAIRLFDLRTGAVWATLGPHDAPVRFVEFSRDGRLVLTVDAEANMKLWRVQPASPNPPPPSVPPPPPEIGWRRLQP